VRSAGRVAWRGRPSRPPLNGLVKFLFTDCRILKARPLALAERQEILRAFYRLAQAAEQFLQVLIAFHKINF
jgi:hypothetical protein